MTVRLPLAAFLALVVGGGLAIGYATAPGDWYAALAKPSFTPPGWLFAPVWTVLYVFIAIAGWRISHRHPGSAAMKFWWGQLALNFLWSPAFFAAHRIALAFAIVVLLLAVVVAFLAAAWPRDRLSAWLFLPYACWVAFAAALNGSILRLN
jgi:tryptophan-rich sensory protein